MLDKRLLKDSEGFNKYNQLSLSHKVELLSLKSPDEKVGWAEKSVDNKWSVRELRKAMGKVVPDKQFGLITLALHPEKITDVSAVNIRNEESKRKFIEKSDLTIQKLEKEITILQSSLEKLLQLKERVNNHQPKEKGKKKHNK